MDWNEQLEIYDQIVAKCDRFERKGKGSPYTSANGYMFSSLNKAGELGIRFSEETKKKYIQEFKTTEFKSYGAVMKGYILISKDLLKDTQKIVKLLNETMTM